MPGERPLRWPLVTLVVGDAARTEFRDAVAQIRLRTQAAFAINLDEALATPDELPDLVVLLAARPGEFTATEVERLRRAAPVARVIALLGSWCEGETRSGAPLPAVTRVYWHAWSSWFEREIEALECGRSAALSLPLTVSEEERPSSIVKDVDAMVAAKTIGTSSGRREMADMLADACRSFGYQAVELSAGLAPNRTLLAAGVWDQASLADENFAGLREIAQQYPGIPWIALATFPRTVDRAQAHTCGACEVISKPLLLADLRAALRRALAHG